MSEEGRGRDNVLLAGLAFLSVLATAALVVTVVLRVQDQNRIDRVASSTHDALCTFKHDLEVRVAASQKFLDDIHHGLRQPIQGVSDTDLRRSIASQRATLASLSTLKCKESRP